MNACVKQLGSLKYEASQHNNSEDRLMNTVSVDLNFPREIQDQQKELKLSVTIAKMGTALGSKTRTALKYCSRHQVASLFKFMDKEEILPSLESIPDLLPLPDQNKREHIATMLRDEGCCLFL